LGSLQAVEYPSKISPISTPADSYPELDRNGLKSGSRIIGATVAVSGWGLFEVVVATREGADGEVRRRCQEGICGTVA